MKKPSFSVNLSSGVCRVSTRQPHSYLAGDLDIIIGDKVLVPVGSAGKEVVATVVSTSQHMRITAPYPVDKAHKVIKELDD